MKTVSKVFPVLYPDAAGIDISSKEHYVAVRPDVAIQPIRSFGAFTEDLRELTAWLIECKVTTVAMEATGIYWVSLYLILEEAGLEVVLVNARHVKNVRGKKSDVSDAEWIRQLHSCGLLSAGFQPDSFTRKLRTYVRHRKNLTEMSATHVRMMQKGLEQMNIKLQHVIADITGKSGQAIIRAILNGERDPERLVELLDYRIKASKEDILKSLDAVWKEEHIFEIRQSYETYLFYKERIRECDKEIEIHLKSQPHYQPIPPAKKVIPVKNKNSFSFNAGEILKQITGIDLTEIFGINENTAVEILSEIGWDMSKWPTEKHFTSWLNLAPNNKISGGKVLGRRTQKKKNKAGQVFKVAANSVQRSKNWLAAFFHRIKQKAGVGKAVTATARKIAIIFYRMLKDNKPFQPIPLLTYQEMFKEQRIRRLKRQALNLGLEVIPKWSDEITS